MGEQNCDIPIYTVDSFTDEPFRGNPAAVCLLPPDLTLGDEMLQKIAAEMNLSETSFIQSIKACEGFDTGSEFTIRWFTPTSEVPLCGHATLAASAVIFFCQKNMNKSVTFSSKSGPLIVRTDDNRITMDFPVNRVEEFDRSNVTALLKIVCDPTLIKDVKFSPTTKKLLLRLNDDVSRDDLEGLCPDTRSLQASETTGHIKGVIVTVKAASTGNSVSNTYDFFSRYFAPWVGLPEDPVTGSAHTVLADYWSKHLGRTHFKARQCSKRGGDIDIKIVKDRVELSGKARIVLTGTLKL